MPLVDSQRQAHRHAGRGFVAAGAGLHGEQARQKAEQLAQLAEPALLLLTGTMVCGLVVMLYLPLLQLGEVFSQF
ncbi:MAG: hypothetical protein ACR5LG_01875 [Sodalis sp. (in: enterobacteria)]|uniref:hypothetical protein n=1 Tax=Sodalis sp. (in: enterobacteria) TaxID=1898979 RepID=UPI003F3AC10E